MSDKTQKQCARCGSCTVVCPVFRVTGRETLAARGKLHLLSTELADQPSHHFQDLFAQCLLCGACEENCSRQLPILDQIVTARSTFSQLYGKHPLQRVLAREILSRSALLESLVKAGLQLSRLPLLPEESGLRIKLGLLEQKNTENAPSEQIKSEEIQPAQDGIRYFSGCMARYLQPGITHATADLVNELTGLPLYEPDQQVCCGLAAWSAGKIEETKRLARKNIEAFDGTGEVLTSCASCSAHLFKYPDLFADEPEWYSRAVQFSDRVREFTSYIDEHIGKRKLTASSQQRVYYHEPCHLRFAGGKNDAARKLLARAGASQEIEPEGGSPCCGQGGLFHIGYPELSAKIFSQAHELAEAGKADLVITSCSGCLMQWQAGLAHNKSRITAIHFALWLKEQLQINR